MERTKKTAEAKGEILGPEDESELLGCQDAEEAELVDGLLTEYAVTAEGGLRLREEPSLKAPVLAVLPWGAGVFAVEPSIGEWIHVSTGLLDGWMMAEHLAPLSPELRGVISYE